MGKIPFRFHPWRKTWQPTLVFLPGEPMDRGAWLQSIGSQRARHDWVNLALTPSCRELIEFRLYLLREINSFWLDMEGGKRRICKNINTWVTGPHLSWVSSTSNCLRFPYSLPTKERVRFKVWAKNRHLCCAPEVHWKLIQFTLCSCDLRRLNFSKRKEPV